MEARDGEDGREAMKEAVGIVAGVIEPLNGLLSSLSLYGEALRCRAGIDRYDVFGQIALTKEVLESCLARLNEAAEILERAQMDATRGSFCNCDDPLTIASNLSRGRSDFLETACIE